MQHDARLPIIGIHLDQKGVAFKPEYIPDLLGDLAGQGINTVLIEYEDTFPFHGIDIAWDRRTRWNENTLRLFRRNAIRNGIEIIPLQQCLGHLEYLFRWDAYRQFAENRKYPGTLCLSNPRGKRLIFDMLIQIMAAHPESRFVHLGMDEAHSLATCPKCRRMGDVLDVFVAYLHELCDIVESFGKTPLIWSDMLEDHFRLEPLRSLKDRVILMPWDYGANGRPTAMGRLAGFRMSRAWLDEAGNAAAPSIGPHQQFIEDYPPAIRAVVKPYLKGRFFKPLFQADLWTKLGFRIIGPSHIRVSADGPVMSRYTHCQANLRAWSAAIKRNRQLGHIATSWARGTTFCPPNFNIDLTWPNIAVLAQSMGMRPKPFWPGIPAATVRRIVEQLGRSRLDWRLEAKLADEMEALAPRIRAHRYEWQSMILMARVLHLQRRSDFAQIEVNFFHANNRPVDSEWQRRLDDQIQILRNIAALKKRVIAHFGRRYHGVHFREWVADIFDLHVERLRECRSISRRKLRAARHIYATRRKTTS